MSLMDSLKLPREGVGALTVDGVADGFEAFALAAVAREVAPDGPTIFILRDGQRLPALVDTLRERILCGEFTANRSVQ